MGRRGLLAGLATAAALVALLVTALAIRAHGGTSTPARADAAIASASASASTQVITVSTGTSAAAPPAGWGSATATTASAGSATLVTPRSSSPPAPAATPTVGTVMLTEADSGRTITVHTGTTIVVSLAASSSVYRWTEPATSSSTTVARSGGSANADGSASATFQAIAPGSAHLSATDNPTCYPRCLPPSRLWTVAIVVTA